MALKSLILNNISSGTPVICSRFVPTGLFNSHQEMIHEICELKNWKIICVAATASSRSFLAMLKSLGANVIQTYFYPDHHYYSERELEEIVNAATSRGAKIITTEKDIVKIKRIRAREDILYLGIDFDFGNHEEFLKTLIRKKINENI